MIRPAAFVSVCLLSAPLDGGHRFAVDSWYRDNGELPYIQLLDDWQRKRDFPASYNPEIASLSAE